MSKFKTGQKVFVTTVKKNGEILQVRKNGSYVINVGSLQITCSEEDLTAPSAAKGAEARQAIRGTAGVAGKPPTVQDSIDLHGLTRVEALEALEEYLSNAVLADVATVDIVHGIGSGVLKNAVHEALHSYSFVKQFDIMPLNAGTTRVHLG